ncbi:MAG: histidine phosphatase family protein [Bacteroidetes bacterium]|nr:histidine phosphatase family protein [Bacteroidota bacterium]
MFILKPLLKLIQASVLALLVTGLAQAQVLTTFVLVRHAEKSSEAGKDPALSEAGQQRAVRLAEMLKATKVDAVYSTPYQRTRSTVTPLAEQRGLPVQTYDALKGEAIDEMLQRHHGGTVVVCGHSNTIPWTANYLTGNKDLADFADNEYGNLLIVEVAEKGKSKVVWLKY